MHGRELIDATIGRTTHKTHGFWLGHPSEEAKALYCEKLGLNREDGKQGEKTAEEWDRCGCCDQRELQLHRAVQSDLVWISAQHDTSTWRHPEGKPMWDCYPNGRSSLSAPGVFAECESVDEVEKFPWPNPDYMDFSSIVQQSKAAYDQGFAVFGGMWSPFFHVVADFFGMENYFVKMYTDPEVVHAVTTHVVDFYVETNRRCFAQTKQYLSAGFFGNDLGTQISMMIGLESYDEFLQPYIQKIIATVKEAQLPVALHSCGAIEPLIPRMIEAGVDILHPLQAKAHGMEAEVLARKYGGKLIFMGGVDTQQLLPCGTPQEVYDEVMRLRDLFRDDFIVSPSHEALLPDVPLENVIAMSQAAKA